MNTIEINGKVFNEDEIKQLIELVNELLSDNDTMRANVIAMSAKLDNKESQVKKLTQQLFFIQQAFTNNTYNA